MIRFMPEPSSTMEFSFRVSRPPSVAERPVRGTTLIPCSLANRSTADTSSVLRALATAAGIGSMNTPFNSS